MPKGNKSSTTCPVGIPFCVVTSMSNEQDLQVENGHFTRIVNPLIENLVKIPFKGCELAVALHIIRKTYGFQKKQDEISLSQFQVDLGRSRQTIVTALKNLQLVNVVRLVKRGNMKGACNIWEINKYHHTWKLVNMARLVQRNKKPSLMERLNLVKTPRHTKEITKETKESIAEVNSAVWDFKEALKKLDNSPRRDLNIISLYWKNKDPRLTNRLQAEIELKRCLRPAKLLTPYEDDRLVDTMEWLKKNADFKWTLESVQKYITEDLSKLKKKNG